MSSLIGSGSSMKNPIKCKLCGQQFSKEKAERACEHCFLHANCHLIKCPNCGYEFPEEPSWLAKIFRTNRAAGGESGAHESVNELQEPELNRVKVDLQLFAKSVPGELPLARLGCGYSAFISRIETKDRTTLKKLMALGFLPGCEVRVQQRFPAYVIELGNSQYAIDKYVAEQILVQKLE